MNKGSSSSLVTQPVQTIFNQLFLAGLLLGLFGGLGAFWVGTKENYAQFASFLYSLVLLVFVVVLYLNLRKQKAYWSDLFAKDKTAAIGQALSISIFGILLTLALFMAALYLVCYVTNSSDWPIFKTELRLAFSNMHILILVGVAVVVTGSWVVW